MCNCGIQAESNFLLESLAACHDAESKLVMYFTVNTAFVSNRDTLENLKYSIKATILQNRTTYEQTLPISLPPPAFDSKLLTAPKTIKNFAQQIQQKKKIFDLQERHPVTKLELPNKNVFLNSFTSNVFSVCYCNNFIIGLHYYLSQYYVNTQNSKLQ